MAYTFVLASPDRRFPHLRGWMLRVTRDEWDAIMTMHHAVCTNLWCQPDEAFAIRSLVWHGAAWMATAEKMLAEDGVLHIGRTGCLTMASIVHETRTLDTLTFPANDPDPEERVTIRRWAGGSHFYIRSNRRLFVPEKHDSMHAAMQAALQYVPLAQMKFPAPRSISNP
jgi:hypothetical protein